MSRYPNVKFLLGAVNERDFPPDDGREVALVGRSNSGKSSALNALMGRRALARTSKTPGRTQEINFFSIEPDRRLVDLPGYGFARVPAEIQAHWQAFLTRYFEVRQSLGGVIIIMDVRHPLRDLDWLMLEWTASRGLRVHVLLTKADKLSRSEGLKTLKDVRTGLAGRATVQLFSAVTNDGLDEARGTLDAMLVPDGEGAADIKEPR